MSGQQTSPFYNVISDFCGVRSKPACKASVTLGNFSCNSSRNFVATERLHVVRPHRDGKKQCEELALEQLEEFH